MWKTWVTLFLLASGSIANFTIAESKPRWVPVSDLAFGLSFEDVVSRWGPAKEKNEFASLHRDLWIYPAGEVTFEEGLVVEWNTLDNVLPSSQTAKTVSAPETKDSESAKPKKNHGRFAKVWIDVFGELVSSGLADNDDGVDTAPVSPLSNIAQATFQPRQHPRGKEDRESEEKEKRMNFIRAEEEQKDAGY